MRGLIRDTIAPILGLPSELGDAANLGPVDGNVVVTTDSYVVSPLFFPGGDIGTLAVFGTINDLVVSGAKPLRLTLSLILEEGLPLSVLKEILQQIAVAARQCGVTVVTGDTKVVPSGAADGIFINTCGIGVMRADAPVGPSSIRPGDQLVVSGPIGCHGIAVLTARESLGFSPEPCSDCAPLIEPVFALQTRLGASLRAMRDATRGGIAAVLHEWSDSSRTTMSLREDLIPVTPPVRGICELLGLDPLYIANEGTFVAAVAPGWEDVAIETLQRFPMTRGARVIGTVTTLGASPVVIEGILGSKRSVDEPAGAPLPRIC
jgi:hydrogenase expression/formation protein HypE